MQDETFSPPNANSSLATWLDYLEHLHPTSIELGLERVSQVARALGVLKPAPLIFTVAGTNGKGTTCRALETILLAAGYRVGVYSSPHLLRYNERVRIQGLEADDPALCTAFTDIEQQRLDCQVSLTYFEFGTLAALLLFQQAVLDVVILEVGMGGRLDATNIVDTDIAIITSIGLDHTEWLGTDRESIGQEKAGILRPGKPLIIGDADIPDSILHLAATQGAHLYRNHLEWHYDSQPTSWTWFSAEKRWQDLPHPAIPLQNAATALAALAAASLNIDQQTLVEGLTQAALPGRFQQIRPIGNQALLILDVAHNPHAAEHLAQYLQRWQAADASTSTHMVIGMLADKDIAGTLTALLPVVQNWYCATLSVPRGATAEQLAKQLPNQLTKHRGAQAQQFDTVEQAWRQAMREAAPTDRVVVCGSFHTVGQVLQVLEQEKKEQENAGGQ